MSTRRPFEPFRLFMSDGSSYPVRHPDQVIVTARAAYVGLRVNGKSQVAQDVVICDLMHVSRLGPLDKRRANGRKRARDDA
ncbi:MAG: hypothetical protein GY778_22680 [bacterium]|nr:hypothetical protein [bacterium]